MGALLDATGANSKASTTGFPVGQAPSVAQPRLAIVAPSFNRISETFVAAHVRGLLPTATVLVCQDDAEAARFGLPVLAKMDSAVGADWYGTMKARIRRRWGYGPALAKYDRERLKAFLSDERITVVLAEFGNVGAIVAEVCANIDVPMFVYFRGHDATRHKIVPSLRRRYGRLFRQAKGIIAVSNFIADELVAVGCPREKITIIPSGVVPERFLPGKPIPGRLLAVGRLVEMKAPDLTIRAFSKISARFPEARLDIIGDGPLRQHCQLLIDNLGLINRVTLHGEQPHSAVAVSMAKATAFLQHSVTDSQGNIEGFPVAIAEAMATGLPIVATRHSGIPEHVHDGISGWLIEERDVSGMSEAIAQILEDPQRAAKMGAEGRVWALKHLSRAAGYTQLRELMGIPQPL